jgi:hypothetical protein
LVVILALAFVQAASSNSSLLTNKFVLVTPKFDPVMLATSAARVTVAATVGM